MSQLAKTILDDFNNNKKITITQIYYGFDAVNKIKKLFFPTDEEQANEWAKHWNDEEQQNSIFFIYQRKLVKNINIGFKFVIGEHDTGSVLGEEHDYEIGKKKIDLLL